MGTTLAVFGSIHGLTIAFGTTLLGVCIDYPVHLLNHRRFAEHIARRAAEEGWSVRRIEDAVRARVGGEEKPSRPTKTVERPAEILALEERLTDRLGSTVRINYGIKSGKIVIRFGSLDDLERVYRSLLGD